jgi:hypothetical protein
MIAFMPSMAHEILVDLFKNRPSLAAEILVEVLGVSLPAYTEARIASVDLTEIQPAEYRADAVVVLLDREVSVRVIIVQVQLTTDPRKRLSWPAYVTVAMVHGQSEQGVTIAAAVLPAIRRLDDDRARFYYDLVFNSMNDAARRSLETMMKGYEYQSDFAKKYVAQGHAEGLTEGLTKGLTEGLTEGLTKGLTEGLTKGRTEATALNLLTVLRVRGIAVPDAARERILAQKDPERLERWLEKAAVASSIAAVLDEPN